MLPMAACLVPLFAIPLARTTFALQFPPPGLALRAAAVTAVAVTGLTLWCRFRPLTPGAQRR